jgi:hypothetical protein
MQFLNIKHEHLHMSFKNNVSFVGIRTNIIHINHSIEFMQFLYKPIKIEFGTKFVWTNET